MQRLLRTLLLAHLVSTSFTGWAQCNIFNPAVKLNRTTANSLAGSCEINLDLYFDMQANAGGKYVYVHIWPKSKYPNLTYTNPPAPTQLTDAVATMGFYHFGNSLYLLDTYAPYSSITNYKYAGLSMIKSTGSVTGSDRFTIQNISITGPAGCAVAQDFTADVWQSQSASAQNVHCFSKGLNFFANDPQVNGSLICGPPRSFQFQVKTIDQTGLTINYKVVIDNGDGIYNASNDNIQVASGSNVTLSNTNGYTFVSGTLGYLPYSNQKPEADRALWIIVSSPTRSNEAYAKLNNNCFLLPVALTRFDVYQSNGKAVLEWTTASETENQGFEVERKDMHLTGDVSNFRNIGFIPSSAPLGNSQEKLNYRFIDPSALRSDVQYRIKQVDLSGKFSYSPVRYISIRSMLDRIQPNPANTEVTVLLANRSTAYRIEWVSTTGQTIGTWNAKGMITIPTETFPNGFHWIRVIDPDTGRSESKKIMIQHMQ